MLLSDDQICFTPQATSSGSSVFSVSRGAAPTSVPFEGLALGPLVGSGSFGRVYRGTLHGEAVAVKVRSRARSVSPQRLPASEASVSTVRRISAGLSVLVHVSSIRCLWKASGCAWGRIWGPSPIVLPGVCQSSAAHSVCCSI